MPLYFWASISWWIRLNQSNFVSWKTRQFNFQSLRSEIIRIKPRNTWDHVKMEVAVQGTTPPQTDHMKSLQWQQNVGCLKNLGMNLWSFTSLMFFFFRAPFRARNLELFSVQYIVSKTMFKLMSQFGRPLANQSSLIYIYIYIYNFLIAFKYYTTYSFNVLNVNES